MPLKPAKPKSKSVKYLYEFGPFTLDGAEHALLKGGAPVPLTPKAIETLMVLVQNSGHTVDKDELMQTVWPDTIVEENNLTQSVSALRKVLGPDHPYIETVPRQGYRFIAMVKERREEVPQLIMRERTRQTVTIEDVGDTGIEQATHLGDAPIEGASLPETKLSGQFLAAGMTLLVAVLAVAMYSARHTTAPVSPGNPAEALAIPPLAQGKYLTVLPFRALGDQASLHYVTEGLSGALTARLFQFKELHVVSAETGDKASPERPVDKVARDLGVNLIVAGMAQETDGKIQVIVSIEDVGGRRKMWTQEFSAAHQDLLALQDRIFVALVGGLGLKPGPEELARNTVHPTENSDAYDLYLKGRSTLRGYKDSKDIEAALGLYQSALLKDPTFALAYAGVADASLEMYEQKKENIWSEKAQHAAQQALRLNQNLAEAHLASGSVHYSMGESEKAIAELKRALELEPNSDEGYRRLGSAYHASGQNEQALVAYRKAIQLSPYYLGNYQMMGNAYLDLGENAKALEAFRRITELEPNNALGYDNVGAVYLRQGRWQESIPVFQKALGLQPDIQAYSNLGTAYFFLKQYADAVKMFEKSVEMNPNDEVAVGNLADAYRWSGQKGKGLSTYDRAIELGYKELQVNPRDPNVLASLALYSAKKGDTTKALELIRRARSYDQTSVELVYIDGVIQTLAGHTHEATKILHEAFQKGYAPDEARNDPELATLHNNPEFEKMMEQFGPKRN